jgi:hypothetical protein
LQQISQETFGETCVSGVAPFGLANGLNLGEHLDMTEMTKIESARARHHGERMAFFHSHPEATERDFEIWANIAERSYPKRQLEHYDKVCSACVRALKQPGISEMEEIKDLTYALAYNETLRELWCFLAQLSDAVRA